MPNLERQWTTQGRRLCGKRLQPHLHAPRILSGHHRAVLHVPHVAVHHGRLPRLTRRLRGRRALQGQHQSHVSDRRGYKTVVVAKCGNQVVRG